MQGVTKLPFFCLDSEIRYFYLISNGVSPPLLVKGPRIGSTTHTET